jgi:hypothetical protein
MSVFRCLTSLGCRTGRRVQTIASLVASVSLVAASYGCVCPAPWQPRSLSSATPAAPTAPSPNIDQELTPLLVRYAVLDPVLDDVGLAVVDVVTSTLRPPLQFGGYNASRTNDDVYAYVVDQRKLMLDAKVCGPTGNSDDVAIRQRDTCNRITAFEDNCAAIAPKTIVCDFRLIWRLSRHASMLAISSLKKPNADEYWFPREEMRRKFLAGEPKYTTTDLQLENLRSIQQSFDGKFAVVKDAELRVLRGFVMFLFSHEAGHIILKHTHGTALPPCAFSDSSGDGQERHVPWRLCQSPSTQETDADAVAFEVLSRDLSPNAFTPARASAELFVEEHERRQYQAILDAGQDPATWKYETAAPEFRAKFDEAWMRRIATGSHPKDLLRYVMLLDLLESNGIFLTASKEKKEIAETELKTIRKWCQAATH